MCEVGSDGAAERSGRAYQAFISYSHAVDGKLAPALQTALQDFAKPWFRRRSLRIFRDDTGLSATPELWTSIELALSRSEYLILLASPDAAQSPWVDREVAYWAHHRSASTVLVALTDGDLRWDPANGALDVARTDALPPSALSLLPNEPLYVDLRWARHADHLSLRQPLFRDAVARLAAPLHGKSKDELIGEDLRRHRRRIRAAWSLAVVFALLAVFAGIAAFVARDQRNRARAERDVAISRQLAAQADAERENRLDRSLLLAVEAWAVDHTVEAKRAIVAGLESAPAVTGFLPGQGPARAVSFGEGDGVLVSTEADGVVLWDVERRERRAELRSDPQRGAVTAVALGPGGETLAAGRAGGSVDLWDLVAQRRRGPPLEAGDGVTAVAFSGDGTVLAVAANHIVTVWQSDGSRKLAELTPGRDDALLSVAFSPGAKTLVTGSELGRIAFWDAETFRPVGQPTEIPIGDYTQRVTTLAFSPDGARLAWGGNGQGLVGLMTIADGATTWLAGHSQPVTSLSFDRRRYGQTLATGSVDGTVIVWDVADRKPLRQPLPGHGIVNGVALTADGQRLASASEEGVTILFEPDRRLRLGRGLQGGASDLVTSVAFSRNGATLASASFDSINLWDVAGRRAARPPIRGARDMFVESVAFSPREDALLAAGGVEGVALWDAGTGARRAGPVALDAQVSQVAFSPDGAAVAALTETGSVIVLDVPALQRRGDPMDVGPKAAAIAFSPADATILAVGGNEGVTLWNVRERRRTGTLATPGTRVLSVAFGPARSSTVVAGRQDGRVSIWDARTGRTITDLVHSPGVPVVGVAASGDGRTLATVGGQDVVLWDVPGGQQLVRPLAGERDKALAAAFSPDGHTLAWGALAIRPSSELLVIWDADLESWIRRACALAARNLTRDEWTRIVATSGPYRRTCAGTPAG